MIKGILLAALALVLLACVVVYASASIPDLRRNISMIYKRTPALVLVFMVCALSVEGISLIATGSLTTDFHVLSK